MRAWKRWFDGLGRFKRWFRNLGAFGSGLNFRIGGCGLLLHDGPGVSKLRLVGSGLDDRLEIKLLAVAGLLSGVLETLGQVRLDVGLCEVNRPCGTWRLLESSGGAGGAAWARSCFSFSL